jgi:hypothetical protein
MAAVMIGVDPHKGSHTAVAISAGEEPLGQVRVRASAVQAQRLLSWAAPWPERIWAVEGAGGLGHLLAQQLLGAGEQVLDVQPKLGARVRLLADSAVKQERPLTTPARSRRCAHRPGVPSRPMITQRWVCKQSRPRRSRAICAPAAHRSTRARLRLIWR